MQIQRVQRQLSLHPAAAVRASAPQCRCVAAKAAVCTAENAGDVAWNKTYYPKLIDTAKVEKDWCAGPASSPVAVASPSVVPHVTIRDLWPLYPPAVARL
jgi:hypothetical protein